LHDFDHGGVVIEVPLRRSPCALGPPISVHSVEINGFQSIEYFLMHHKVMGMYVDNQSQILLFLPPGFRFVYIITLFHVVPDDFEFLIPDMEQYLFVEPGGSEQGGNMTLIFILLYTFNYADEPADHRL